GLVVLHGLVPPHPGAMVAITALHADLGMALILGILISIPIAIVAGPLYTLWIAPRAHAAPPVDLVAHLTHRDERFAAPGIGVTVFTILFPILLMLGRAAADLMLPMGPARVLLDFTGDPMVALLLAVVLAMFTFGLFIGKDVPVMGRQIADSLPPIASIMLIIGAGGALKQML